MIYILCHQTSSSIRGLMLADETGSSVWPSHNVLPHPGTPLCPLCDGDEVFEETA